MSHRIISSESLAPNVQQLVVEAPHVVRHCGPGQFVIVRTTESGERIPLTIAYSDKTLGQLTLIVQAVGASTRELCAMQAGQQICAVAGPLGRKTHAEDARHAVLIGGGVGTAVIYPQAQALKAPGRRVSAIIGGRARPYVILERELSNYCDAVYPCTDDGSYGFKGFVTQRLQQLMSETDVAVDLVICAGPVPMMRAVAEVTRSSRVKTIASLNPVMVDGTGMCGGCRVQVGGKMMFACVDGPEFDAHAVDFAELSDRLTAYRQQEKESLERMCRAGG